MTKPKRIGKEQRNVLAALIRHGGYWYPACGWYWINRSSTLKILESLVRRGLAARLEFGGTTRYNITDAGRDEAEKGAAATSRGWIARAGK